MWSESVPPWRLLLAADFSRELFRWWESRVSPPEGADNATKTSEDSRRQLVPLPRELLLTKEISHLVLLLTSLRSSGGYVCLRGLGREYNQLSWVSYGLCCYFMSHMLNIVYLTPFISLHCYTHVLQFALQSFATFYLHQQIPVNKVWMKVYVSVGSR